MTAAKGKTYIVEHLEPEIGEWSQLEYSAIANECSVSSLASNTVHFYLTSVPSCLVDNLPQSLHPDVHSGKLIATSTEVSQLPGIQSGRVCLLDPAAKEELSPEDGERFDWFVFGGILGDHPPRGTRIYSHFFVTVPLKHCTRYLIAETVLQYAEPKRIDRTAELRKYGYKGRRLGPKQMTTDTAVRVTRLVVENKLPLNQIPYVDFPELKLSKHESTEMPFRYVRGEDGEPVMPEGMVELIKRDADKSFDF